MCRIFAGQDPARYRPETRHLRLSGHSTSVRLEPAFWTTLEAIAAEEGMSTPAFISRLYDEVLDLHGEVQNFTSLLRCACLTFLERAHPFPARMAAE